MTYDNPVKGLTRVLGLALAMVEGGEGVNVRLRDGNGPVEYTGEGESSSSLSR